MFKIIIGIVLLTITGIIILMNIDPNVPKQQVIDDINLASVTIEGQVMRIGAYPFKDNYTLGSLVSDAGGLTENADPLSYFTDLVLEQGKTYYIAPKYDEADVCGDSPISKVNVNADESSVLVSVNGISNAIANAIVDYRKSNRIDSLEELIEVKGIGNATYNKIRNYVILHV